MKSLTVLEVNLILGEHFHRNSGDFKQINKTPGISNGLVVNTNGGVLFELSIILYINNIWCCLRIYYIMNFS